MNLAELRAEINTLAGLDLTPDQANSLINQGMRELCVRADWTQRWQEFGPTQAGIATYAAPPDLHRILSLMPGGRPYHPVERTIVEETTIGWRAQRDGLYYLWQDPYAVLWVVISPTPTVGGGTIPGEIVYSPADLVDDGDVPPVPAFSHRAIIDYAASVVYGEVEDNPDLMDRYLSEFERRLSELKQVQRTRRSQADQMAAEAAVSGG